MAKADYQLRHQLFGQQGSLWERQVTGPARTQIRRIVKEAGSSPILAKVDQIAVGAINMDKVLVEDEFFRFTDGNFAVVGQHQRDYAHTESVLVDGSRLHLAYRSDPAESSDDPLLTSIAQVTREFIRSIQGAQGTLPSDRDWYLVPMPSNLTPLVIEGRGDDVYLVNGIDFLSRDGYIIMTDDPAQVLPSGLVRVSSAYRTVVTPNAFVLSAPAIRGGSRYLAEYAYKSQALPVFRRAAAEYAGLFVFQSADIILDAVQVGVDHWVYTTAAAGAVEVRYPHTTLARGQEVEPGYVVCQTFDVIASRYNDATNYKKIAAATWGHPISLNGVLPVKGLSWDGVSPVQIFSTETDPETLKPHVRLQLDGFGPDLNRYWDWQKRHELQTGDFLYDALGSPALPSTVDFWDLLENFCGMQLILVLMSEHTPAINTRLQHFITEHRPNSCNALVSVDVTYPYPVEKTNEGIPLLDEEGAYQPYGLLLS